MSWAALDRTKHSRKPDEVRRMVERASPGPRLELFGRELTDGWTVWGNEADSARDGADVSDVAL
jgi:N6-adenosine-specific RNA methylase IME4